MILKTGMPDSFSDSMCVSTWVSLSLSVSLCLSFFDHTHCCTVYCCECRIILVTGASSGIGNHVAIALAQDGYEVSLVGVSETLSLYVRLSISEPMSESMGE